MTVNSRDQASMETSSPGVVSHEEALKKLRKRIGAAIG